MFKHSLEDYLYPSQEKLFKRLRKEYTKGAGIYYADMSFILVKGTTPIMLIAHLDTVHQSQPYDICKTSDGNIIMSPQGIGGDDRCGVYSICKAYDLSPQKPWLLFTCDEEIGGIGANTFVKCYKKHKLPYELDELKFLVEVDRRGANDAVYYDCENLEFEEYIFSFGFQTAIGSFSDISVIAPVLKVAAVNLSSGYYNAHTLHEYINRAELERTTKCVIEMVADAADKEFPRFEYHKNRDADKSIYLYPYNDDEWFYSK